MDFIGFDLGKVASQVCIITQDGELIERRIKTDREHLAKLLGSRAPARILIESATESEWVARYLEALGHEVIVADPNFASMYATRSRKVKTDLRDARTLAEACRLGAYRPAHRTSNRRRHVRAQPLGVGGAGTNVGPLHLADRRPVATRRLAGGERERGGLYEARC